MLEPPDTTTREGAEALARKLTRYWHAQGHTQVQHWVEPQRVLTHRGPKDIWVVRCNLVGGRPPQSTGGKAI